jgi:biopolymer transport protein TolQ
MNILDLILEASLVVKVVMLILVILSLISWAIIFKQNSILALARFNFKRFENKFWSGIDLSKLYKENASTNGIESIFNAGFKEWSRLHKKADNATLMQSVARSMRIAISYEEEKITNGLSFLATIGSVSPYIGLFGTVWGIMNSFLGLGSIKGGATLEIVAPGIAEALIATAIGLFAAIPAVIFYNKMVTTSERLLQDYETFADEFLSILNRTSLGG